MDFAFFRLLDPDLVIIIMVYLFAFRSEAGAVFFAFGQGFLIDIFSGGMLSIKNPCPNKKNTAPASLRKAKR